MSTSPKNSNHESNTAVEDATVPAQASKPKTEKVAEATVTAIKKNNDEEFQADNCVNEKTSLVGKVKGLAKNKRLLAGVSTAAVLTVSVLVIRKRNSQVDDENVDETPSA